MLPCNTRAAQPAVAPSPSHHSREPRCDPGLVHGPGAVHAVHTPTPRYRLPYSRAPPHGERHRSLLHGVSSIAGSRAPNRSAEESCHERGMAPTSHGHTGAPPSSPVVSTAVDGRPGAPARSVAGRQSQRGTIPDHESRGFVPDPSAPSRTGIARKIHEKRSVQTGLRTVSCVSGTEGLMPSGCIGLWLSLPIGDTPGMSRPMLYRAKGRSRFPGSTTRSRQGGIIA